WESDLLPARMKHHSAAMLDRLCVAGRVAWFRPGSRTTASEPRPAGTAAGRKSGPVRVTPILWSERETLAHWRQPDEAEDIALSSRAQRVHDSLKDHGASFLTDLVQDTGLLRTDAELALGEL